jgi:hypothetical protein
MSPTPTVRVPFTYVPPPGCSYRDDLHEYQIAGIIVPSVTQILNEEGFVDFSQVPRYRLAEAQARGTRVHRYIHYWLEQDLDETSVWEEDRGYLQSAITYIEATRRTALTDASGRYIGIEFRFWNLHYLYGDALLSKLPKNHRLRSAPIRRRAVKLYRDGATARVEPYTDPRDWAQFLNALSCAHYRRNGLRHDTPSSRDLRRLLDGYV